MTIQMSRFCEPAWTDPAPEITEQTFQFDELELYHEGRHIGTFTPENLMADLEWDETNECWSISELFCGPRRVDTDPAFALINAAAQQYVRDNQFLFGDE